MIDWIYRFFNYVYWCFRPLVKWFLRKTTRLCELQRICYGEERGYHRTSKVEMSLNCTRSDLLKRIIQQLNSLSSEGRFYANTSSMCVENGLRVLLKVKNINPDVHSPFIHAISSCFFQIYGYKQLVHDVEVLRKIPYSSENSDHENKLLWLWKLLKPEENLASRISKQWTEIGFQGDDPKTDFRGMGVLGLENLLYFAREYNSAARHVLQHSNHPTYGYSFAIVGINLTSMAYHLLKNGNLKVHFYNALRHRPSLRNFHHVYCYLFYEFDRLWLSEKPRDIMEFNRIRDKFEQLLSKKLENPKTVLKLNFAIETL